ncbi:syncytin-1-like [Marmota monax]|uniref:syncytin-1-like n=1 Tax=Marmota monax TaxID=9995 RepID=UPI0026E9547F|nr:syncytin-1-like [Marmota monax]
MKIQDKMKFPRWLILPLLFSPLQVSAETHLMSWTPLVAFLLDRFVEGGLDPPPGNIHEYLFGAPCECKGGPRHSAPSGYIQSIDCGTKVAYMAAELNENIGGFKQPKWVCVNKPGLVVPNPTETLGSCPATCHYTPAMHISCYTSASICVNNQGKQYFEAILTNTRGEWGTTYNYIPFLGDRGGEGITTRLTEAGCEGVVGKPSCWPMQAPIGISDGGGPTDAIKHLQVIKLLKPEIPKPTYHPLILPKSQFPDLDANTLDILETTFSLLNSSNPTLAGDCWLCMTAGAVMPLAVPINYTIDDDNTCQSGLPFKVQPLGGFMSCLLGMMQNNTYDVDVGISSFGNCSLVKNYSSPTPPICPPNGTVFMCGGNLAFPRLPANWTGGCVLALLLPDITIISGDEPLPIPSLDILVRRHKRAVQALPLLVGLGITAAVGTGTAGLGTAIHSYRRLSQQLIDDVQTLSGTIKDLQDQIDSLAEVVLQNRRGLDLLTANQGGICLALGERCCFYANKSGIVRTKIKQLQEDLEKRRRELFENPLWTGLNGFLPYLLPLLGPLLGLLLVVAIGPCIVNKIVQFIKDQINILASKPIQVHYQRLKMDDRLSEIYFRPIRR